jgi:hypothetical protein
MSNKELASSDIKGEALELAQQTIKYAKKPINYRDLSYLHTFIGRLSVGATRNKVTVEECKRVVRIAKSNA